MKSVAVKNIQRAEQGIVAKWPDAESGADQKIVVLKDGKLKSES